MLASLLAVAAINLAPGQAITAGEGTYFNTRSVGVETTGYGSDSFPTRQHWNRDHDVIVFTFHGKRVATFNGITYRNLSKRWLHIVADADTL